jgi:hypothetical protein
MSAGGSAQPVPTALRECEAIIERGLAAGKKTSLR